MTKKRTLSLLLSLAIFLTFMPGTAFAYDNYYRDDEEFLERAGNAYTVEGSGDLTKKIADHLWDAVGNKQEHVYIRVPKSQEQLIENTDEGNFSIQDKLWNYFDYQQHSGLYDSADYDIYCGPFYNDKAHDPADSDYTIFEIGFEYHENKEELAKSDAKLKEILSQCAGSSDAGKVKYLWNWMKKNIPAEKDSDEGYPRNCNGIYGCLFGDGTGYVCSTYALTIQRFCELAGIESYILSASDINHAFNLIKSGGSWYVTDYTNTKLLMAGTDRLKGEFASHKAMVAKYAPSCTLAKKSYTGSSQEDVKPSTPQGETTPDSGCAHVIKSVSKAATCKETGLKKHFECTECGKMFADKNGTKELNAKAIRKLTTARKKHNYKEKKVDEEHLKSAATCTKPAVYYYSCKMCHEKGKKTFKSGKALGHKFEQSMTKATPGKNGSIGQKCTVCGKKGKTKVIPKASKIAVVKKYKKKGVPESALAGGKFIEVKNSKGKKIAAAEYEISFENNVEAGTGVATITFVGANYEGTKTVNYKIAK